MRLRISRLVVLLFLGCLMAPGVRAAETDSTAKSPTDQVKRMLMQAAEQAVHIASQDNAYYSNEKIKIPFPSDLKDVQSQLTRAGEATAAQVTESVRLMNVTADEAAKSALPLLQKAIDDLSIKDAAEILSGDAQAATDYFRKESKSLKYSYKPVVKAAMEKDGIQKVWEPLLVLYSDLAENDSVVSHDDPENVWEGFDLNFYISERAMNGLYVLMGEEEAKIRAKK